MKIRYQQGDVIITKEDDQAKFNKEYEGYSFERKKNVKKDSVVLALGEVTGHSHQFKPEETDMIVSYHRKRNRYDHDSHSSMGYIGDIEAQAISVLDEDMTLYHEEHAPITIPKGNYSVRIVREFDHMSQTSRRVWD